MESISLHFAIVNFAAVSLISTLRLKQLFQNPSKGSKTPTIQKIGNLLFLFAVAGLLTAAIKNPTAILWTLTAVSLITLAVQYFYEPPFLITFAAPLATAVLSFFWTQTPYRATVLHSVLDLHIACALMGHLLAMASGIISMLFLWQHFFLRRRKLTHLLRHVPALDLMEKILLASLSISLLFLTLALASGVFIYYQGSVTSTAIQLKLIFSLVVWASYLCLLVARLIFYVPLKIIATLNFFALLLLAWIFWGRIL